MSTTGADVLNAYGYNFMQAGDYAQAAYWLRRAIEVKPDDRHALNNLASTLKSLGRETEAIAIYERLVRDAPDFMPPFNNLAFSYLRNSRFAEGWEMYYSRHKANAKRRTQINPLTGKEFWQEKRPTLNTVAGRDVILVPEQGLGDELFFLRFAQKLYCIDYGRFVKSIWYAPTIKLYPVLKAANLPWLHLTDQSFSAVPRGNVVAIPLADLPMMLGHDGAWFPDSLKLRGIEPAASTSELPLLGVTWRAGTRELVHKGGIFKGINPAALGAAIKGKPYRVIVIQRDVNDDELSAFTKGYGTDDYDVFRHSDLRVGEELLACASMLASLTEYIGVSNTNMHLMAAMGRTARVLVIHPAEWRWPIAGKEESPWFPGFRLYRQTVVGWDEALAKLRGELG